LNIDEAYSLVYNISRQW